MTLDFESHLRMGIELASMRDRLMSLSVLISNNYPPGGSRLELAARRMTEKIDEVRSQLDNEVVREFENSLPINTLMSAYYPDPEDRVVWEQWWQDPPVNATWDGTKWRITFATPLMFTSMTASNSSAKTRQSGALRLMRARILMISSASGSGKRPSMPLGL